MTFTSPHFLDGAAWAGMRVGLLGGSFNPPHEGHVHISLIARETLKLDFVWWLLSPGNPLKDSAELVPYDDRLAQCRAMIRDYPFLLVTDLERQLGISRCTDLKALRFEGKPVKRMPTKAQEVRTFTNGGEGSSAGEFTWYHALIRRQIQFDILRVA